MASAQEDIDLVRSEVRNVLEQSSSYQKMSPDGRRALAQNMVRVASYLASDPGWLDAHPPAEGQGVSEAMGPVDDLKKRLAKAPGQVGAEFQAGAMRQGVEEFGNLVKTVDFPQFVSGLIQGVFQAIVDASIQQMHAYGELLAATAKSVGEFANDHITDDQAREAVVQRFPSLVKIEGQGGERRLVQAEGAEDASALQQYVRADRPVELSNEESERKFIAAAKLEMARQRQKLMALMVMLGINRIIVTDGRINAKVVFAIRASDYAKRQAHAGMDDRAESESAAAAGIGLPWGAAGGYSKSRHTTTVQSAVDDTSESKAQMNAQLSGEVRVNFRSETLPPERMLDALQFDRISALSQPGGAPGAAPAAAPAAGAARPRQETRT